MPVINFVWDELSDNVLMETDVNDATVATYTNDPSQFGEVVSQHRLNKDNYFIYDGLGSTRNLTRSNQGVTDSYTYSAFGETVASSGSTTNPFQFNGAAGYYTNEETGDFYVRRRTYDPTIARWLSRDPLGFVDGPNVYSYVANIVPGGIDPEGTVCRCCCKGGNWSTVGLTGWASSGGLAVGVLSFAVTISCDTNPKIQTRVSGRAVAIGVIAALSGRVGVFGGVTGAPNCANLYGGAGFRAYGLGAGVVGASALFISTFNGAYYSLYSAGATIKLKNLKAKGVTLVGGVGKVKCVW